MSFAIYPFIFWKIWKSTTIIFIILSSICIWIFGWEKWYINLFAPAVLISISIFISIHLQNVFLDIKVKKKLKEISNNKNNYVGKIYEFNINGQQGIAYINKLNIDGTYNIEMGYGDGFTQNVNIDEYRFIEFVKKANDITPTHSK